MRHAQAYRGQTQHCVYCVFRAGDTQHIMFTMCSPPGIKTTIRLLCFFVPGTIKTLRLLCCLCRGQTKLCLYCVVYAGDKQNITCFMCSVLGTGPPGMPGVLECPARMAVVPFRRTFRSGVLAWCSAYGVPAWRSGVLGVLCVPSVPFLHWCSCVVFLAPT